MTKKKQKVNFENDMVDLGLAGRPGVHTVSAGGQRFAGELPLAARQETGGLPLAARQETGGLGQLAERHLFPEVADNSLDDRKRS